MAKIFVLDTNIILHDHQAIKRFQENDLVIPIAVIEELDKFKKGNDALSFNARAFMRDINKLTDKREFGPEGISLGKRLGNIKIEPNHPFTPEFADLFKDDTQDHRILSTALWVRAQNPGRFVALVTKDINLRPGDQGHQPAPEGEGRRHARAGLPGRPGGRRTPLRP